jgi:hypothetical protein
MRDLTAMACEDGAGFSLWMGSSPCRWHYGVGRQPLLPLWVMPCAARVISGIESLTRPTRILLSPRPPLQHTSPMAHTRRENSGCGPHAKNRARTRRTLHARWSPSRAKQMARLGVHSLLHLLYLQREHRRVHEPLAQKLGPILCGRDQRLSDSYARDYYCDHVDIWLDERCVATACADCVLLAYGVLLCGGQSCCLGWCAVPFEVGVVLPDQVSCSSSLSLILFLKDDYADAGILFSFAQGSGPMFLVSCARLASSCPCG